MKRNTPHGRRRVGTAFHLGKSDISVYRYEPGQMRYNRISGADPALPDALLLTRPRRSQINSPLLLTDTVGRVLTGLRPASPGLYRGDLLGDAGTRSLLVVRCWQTADGANMVEARHFPEFNLATAMCGDIRKLLIQTRNVEY